MVCAILPAAPPLRPSEPIIFTLACTRVSIASFAPGVGFDMLIFLSNKFCRDHINVVRTEWSFAFVEYSDGGFQKASLEGKGLLFTGVAYVFNHKKRKEGKPTLFFLVTLQRHPHGSSLLSDTQTFYFSLSI